MTRIRRSRRNPQVVAGVLLESLEARTLLTAFTLNTIAAFTGRNGSYPFDTNLTIDSHGNVFGITQLGGAFGKGVVFEIASGTSTMTTIASFNGRTNGGYPVGSLVVDGAGNIYGVTGGDKTDNGTVFEIAQGTHSAITLATFNKNGSEGSYPLGVAIDSQGNLFGVTQNGGANSNGTVFELVKGSGTVTTLVNFDGVNGGIPEGNVLIDSHDNIFGSTERGGDNNTGALFEITAGAHSFSTLASFGSDGANGISPMGAMVMDGQGNIFGTAQFGGITDGGQNSNGMVYELASGSNTITAFAKFTSSTGTSPFSGLVMDSGGNLFGTTTGGGTNGAGTVFEIAKNSTAIVVLASQPGPYGNIAAGNIVVDSLGNIFGTTDGGAANHGSVFELSPTQATRLAFSEQPVNATANQTLSTITVSVEDTNGRVISNDNSFVTLTIASGPGGSTLLGTVVVQAVDGVATFSDLALQGAGNYTLTATDGGLDVAVSNSFVISPAAPAVMVFQQNPSSGIAGGVFASTLSVAVTDAFGNLVTNAHSTIALSVNGSNGVRLRGATSAPLINGVATFRNLSISKAGGYTLLASGGSLLVSSGSFTIAPAAAAMLVFVQQPTGVAVGGVIVPGVTVAVEDRFGNVVTADSSSVVVSIGIGPRGGVLGGVTSVPAQNGVAVFETLSMTAAGNYRLRAVDVSLMALSGSFTVGTVPTAKTPNSHQAKSR